MTDILKDGFEILVNDEMGRQCDGLVQDIEARWGQYLMTFENDHLEIIGFQPDHNPANVFNLVADNIRVSEIKMMKLKVMNMVLINLNNDFKLVPRIPSLLPCLFMIILLR